MAIQCLVDGQYNAKIKPRLTGVLFIKRMYMIYSFNENGKEITVAIERWVWGVQYKDGSYLQQFDDMGRFHQFKEIDHSKVHLFYMYKPEDQTKRVELLLSDTMQIFHFYRNICLEMLTEQEKKIKIYCFGWKDKVTGAQLYNFIMPDDRLIFSSDDIKLF
jgi:hypothetical protein